MAFNKVTDVRTSGWCSIGDVLLTVEPKRDLREKISSFAVVGYNEGVLDCYPVPSSFNAVFMTIAVGCHFLPYLPEIVFWFLTTPQYTMTLLCRMLWCARRERQNAYLLLWLKSHWKRFSIVKGNPLKSPGSIRAKRMASVVNTLVGVRVPVGQLFYSTFIQKFVVLQQGYHHTRRLTK